MYDYLQRLGVAHSSHVISKNEWLYLVGNLIWVLHMVSQTQKILHSYGGGESLRYSSQIRCHSVKGAVGRHELMTLQCPGRFFP